jgi:hypothetical protein
MTKRITATLTEPQWDALMTAIQHRYLEFEAQAGTLEEGASLRESAVLERAEDRLRAGAAEARR